MFFWSGIACGSFGLGSSGFLFTGSPVPLGLWEAPWPIAFRLRGQDPLLILALGALQWVRGPFCLFLSPSFLVWFSCPQVVERDPSYPPLADSPSLPTPSRIGRMASRQEGGGRDFVLCLWWADSFPFLPPGSCFCFVFVLCAVYVLCFDNLRVLLDGLFLLFVLIFLSFVVRLQDPVFDPGVSGTVVGFPVSLWSCVLLMLRHAVSVFFFLF